ncbi:MAG: histidine kinase [Candidatus Kapaibacterium sp.]|nr:MAG: histidine kinase [Candidatus Kapabacteria bacterium]
MKEQFRFIRFILIPALTLTFTSLGYMLSMTDAYGQQFILMSPLTMVIDICSSVVYTLICSEISLRLFVWLQQHFPIETKLRKLIITHLFLTSFLWIAVFTVSQLLLVGFDTREKIFLIKTNILFALVVAIGMNAMQVGMLLFERWKEQTQETEELKRVSLEAQNEALKQQIDPHFLFNSLNTLTALIEEEPRLATKFVKELSNVYRYVLQSKDTSLIPLDDELTFIRAYLYLHELRFGDNLRVSIDTAEASENLGLPPLALQLCVENAVKHNIISKRQPLSLRIHATGNSITVSNALQIKRTPLTSTNLGLQNIRHRYSLLTSIPVEVQQSEHTFSVTLPLLPLKYEINERTQSVQIQIESSMEELAV